MSIQMTHEPVLSPAGTAGAHALSSRLTARLLRMCNATWHAMEAMGQRRAERELRRLAAAHSHHPEFARHLREAASQMVQPDGRSRPVSPTAHALYPARGLS
jgi:hypothetical protein